MLIEFKVIIFLFTKLDLAPLGSELTIRPAFLVGEELFLAHAVVTCLFVLVDLAFVPQTLEHSLHASLVQRISRGCPGIVTHIQFLPKRAKLFRKSPNEFFRRNAFLFRRALHLLPVLIDAREKENLVTFEPMIT